ncbi:MAG: hypothetical protein PHI18_09270 [bacterium]|nr:hypothetical protein [bacterium]
MADDQVAKFRVPVGVDDTGQLVAPNQATKEHCYKCPAPGCGTSLILRCGRKPLKSGRTKLTHFAHKPNALCSPDRVTHGEAQHRIVEAIRKWKAGETEAPIVLYKCEQCGEDIFWPIPNDIEEGVLEYGINIGGRVFRLDVALLINGIANYAVEVHQTHYVEENKSEFLGKGGITYFEVEAEEVIRDPLQWKMINHQATFTICAACQKFNVEAEQKRLKEEIFRQQEEKYEIEKQKFFEQEEIEAKKRRDEFRVKCDEAYEPFMREARELAQHLNIILPTRFFRFMIVPCWRCKKRIFVYTWPGKRKWEGFRPEYVAEAFPSTMKYVKNKKTQSRYWANSCKLCDAIQGDNYIDFPLVSGYDNRSFREDMEVIGYYHFNPAKIF